MIGTVDTNRKVFVDIGQCIESNWIDWDVEMYWWIVLNIVDVSGLLGRRKNQEMNKTKVHT